MNNDNIILKSNDDYELYLPIVVAKMSDHISELIANDKSNSYVYEFKYNKTILEIIVDYLFFKFINYDTEPSKIPEFKFNPELALELYKAATFFKI